MWPNFLALSAMCPFKASFTHSINIACLLCDKYFDSLLKLSYSSQLSPAFGSETIYSSDSSP